MPQTVESGLNKVVFEGDSIPSLEDRVKKFIRDNRLEPNKVFASILRSAEYPTKGETRPCSYTLIYI